MITIAIIRPFGHNVGNSAINFALRHMLYDVFGRLVSVIDFPATNQHESTSKSGLTAQTIHEINRIADGVIVGGGNLYENGDIDIDIVALNALQPPLLLFSNSRGKIYSKKNKWIDRSDVISDSVLSKLVNLSDISASRDSSTNAHIKNTLGISKDILGYCPTINTSRYESLLPELPNNEYVGTLVAVRTPNLMNLPYWRQTHVIEDVEFIINKLKLGGHKRIRLLCNDSRDIDFAGMFEERFSINALYTSDVYQYLSLLNNADLVVSYRLHASLPSISMNTPTINISYDERSKCLFGDLGLKNNHICMLNRDSFYDQLADEINNNGTQLPLDLKSTWSSVYDVQFAILEEFKSLVRGYIDEN